MINLVRHHASSALMVQGAHNGLSDMEKGCCTGKVNGRLGLLNWKFSSRLAMLYGIADEQQPV